MNKPVIAGAGLACMDYFVVGPQCDWGDMSLCTDNYQQGGGPVATAMVASARLGGEVTLYSFIGDDATGGDIVKELRAEGIDCRIPCIPDANSAFSYIYINPENADRTIFHRPASAIAKMSIPDGMFDFSVIDGASALLIDDFYPHLPVLASDYARKKGVTVIADLKPSEANMALVKNTDILIAPSYYPGELGCADHPEKALEVMHGMGIKIAIVTLGSEGWIYSDGSTVKKGNAYKVKAVDTNGAGDTFHGAFTYAYSIGYSLDRCCDFASAVAGLKCTKAGGRAGIPDFDTTMEFLKKNSSMDW
ncbi:MAG: hypothetical protein IK083_09600 [Abditibacteriota bacterium]|nr:hypothetical protein [Abditibacteriota bacterium]